MRSFEQRRCLDEEDREDFDEDEWCVKALMWIPGGCNVEICEDVDNCPYLKENTSLNS